MGGVMITEQGNATLQTNITVSWVQKFVDGSIAFILFLLSAPIASLVSLFWKPNPSS